MRNYMRENIKKYISEKITGLEDYIKKLKTIKGKFNRKGILIINPAALPKGFPWKIPGVKNKVNHIFVKSIRVQASTRDI